MNRDLLPWQHQAWQSIERWHGQGRLPHALLMSGPRGIGKSRLAQLLMASLVCESPGQQGLACGDCRACRLIAAGTHPDVLRLGPDEEGKAIRVDQIREVVEFTTLKTRHGGWKLVLIEPAEVMNRNASNSLLKTLEEPPPHTLILLVSHAPSALPATVRSRCQGLELHTPPRREALAWLRKELEEEERADLLLRMAHGAPLAALALAARGMPQSRGALAEQMRGLVEQTLDPIEAAEGWQVEGVRETLEAAYSLLAQLIRLKSCGDPGGLEVADSTALKALEQQLDLGKLYRCLDACIGGLGTLERRVNINGQYLLEALAMDLSG